MGFSPIDYCHIPVILKFLEMSTNKIAKFINGIVGSVNFLSEASKNLSGFIAEKLNQNIIFVFEIKIDRAVSDPCFPGNLRNC